MRRFAEGPAASCSARLWRCGRPTAGTGADSSATWPWPKYLTAWRNRLSHRMAGRCARASTAAGSPGTWSGPAELLRQADEVSFGAMGWCSFPSPTQARSVRRHDALIFPPKLGWLRLRLSRSVLGEIKSVTVSGSCGRWHASILTQREVEQPVPQGTAAVGIDMGVARFCDGRWHVHRPLASFKRHEARLRRYQRAMSASARAQNSTRPGARCKDCTHTHCERAPRTSCTRPTARSRRSMPW